MDEKCYYIPTDRLHAMARNQTMPNHARGSVLFADLSGFTPLTEALAQDLGPQRGPEEINRTLNLIFDGLITELHQYSGSVISFGGDAITCVFDGDDGARAVACALNMQQVMQQFSAFQIPSGRTVTLAMKVGIAVGPFRRFLVGDPTIQLFDVLAGNTLDQLAQAEHHARKGEVVLEPQAAAALQGRVTVREWREDQQTGLRYAIVERLLVDVPRTPWPALPEQTLPEDQIRPWLLPSVYERLQNGQGDFLAELRPAVPIFLYFTGIDYDGDEQAGQKLNTFISKVEQILSSYDGNLLSLIIGDKGSYLYAILGVPTAHEDDARRAANAVLQLMAMAQSLAFITEARAGVTQGWLCAGATGSASRRSYVTLGDEVNLAARLMQAAAPGEVLITARVWETISAWFFSQSLAPIKVKGKEKPVRVNRLLSVRERPINRFQEPKYTLPMVGRQAELQIADQRLDQVLHGKGQIIGIMGEAGVGKTRLVAEIIHRTQLHQMPVYGSECEAYGTNTNYLVWRSIWQGLFGLDAHASLNTTRFQLSAQLTQINPDLLPRLPLLGAVLNQPIADNDLTQAFDAKLRKTSLEALLTDVLRAKARHNPLVLVLEDCQWIDDLSNDLLGVLGRAIANLPVLILLNYRPPRNGQAGRLAVQQMAHFTEQSLGDLHIQEAEQLTRLKLGQITGRSDEVPAALLERIFTRTQGNPFYIEELLNFLKERGHDLLDLNAFDQLDLPNSLYSLILSRIDQISESQKVALKVASVIGRMFRAAWVGGYYPQLGGQQQIHTILTGLDQADLTPEVPEEPEKTYVFKHMLTQEVAYESLPFKTRSRLHGLFGQFIEQAYPNMLERFVDLLAFHYDNSEFEEKRREYLLRAGDYAQAQYANASAVDYYRRLLPLLPPNEKVGVSLKLGVVLERHGKWSDAGEVYRQALELACEQVDRKGQADCQNALGDLFRKQGQYAHAIECLNQARELFAATGDEVGMAHVLHNLGTVAAQQSDLDLARSLYQQGLEIRQTKGDRRDVAKTLNNLGIVARLQGDLQRARASYEQALAIHYELGDRYYISASLNNLGNLAIDEGRLDEARSLLEEGLLMDRATGDPSVIANTLNNLGNVVRQQGDNQRACQLYRESLQISQELDAKWSIAYLLEDIGYLVAHCGAPEAAFHLVGAAAALRRTIGAPLSPAEQAKQEALLEPARQRLNGAGWQAFLAEGELLSLEQAIEQALQVTDILMAS